MNPPYDRSLHLKILRQVMNKANEVVNLSTIRWLQDPLAEMKGNRADYSRFADIRRKITSLEVIPKEEATGIFGALFHQDLGIYYLTPEGGWNPTYKNKSILDKVNSKRQSCWEEHIEQNKLDGIRVKTQRVRNSAPSSKSALHSYTIPEDAYDLMYRHYKCIFVDGKQNDKWWTEFGARNKYTKENGSPLIDSIKFATMEEAVNFEASCWTKFFIYLNKHSKVGVNTNFTFLPYMEDYTHSWTDEMLYEYFGLTDSEIQEIEKLV